MKRARAPGTKRTNYALKPTAGVCLPSSSYAFAAAAQRSVRCMKRTLGVILLLLLVFIAALFASAPLLASYDARRVAQHRSPIFCWSHWIGRDWDALDGGSMICRGFGYELTVKHEIVSAT